MLFSENIILRALTGGKTHLPTIFSHDVLVTKCMVSVSSYSPCVVKALVSRICHIVPWS